MHTNAVLVERRIDRFVAERIVPAVYRSTAPLTVTAWDVPGGHGQRGGAAVDRRHDSLGNKPVDASFDEDCVGVHLLLLSVSDQRWCAAAGVGVRLLPTGAVRYPLTAPAMVKEPPENRCTRTYSARTGVAYRMEKAASRP